MTKTDGATLTRLSEAGGTVSKRHGSFVSAFTHDTVIQATDCGGPIVNLDGRAVGLNIARVDAHGDLCDSGVYASHVDAGDAAEVDPVRRREGLFDVDEVARPELQAKGVIRRPSRPSQAQGRATQIAILLLYWNLLPRRGSRARRAAHGVDERRYAARGA